MLFSRAAATKLRHLKCMHAYIDGFQGRLVSTHTPNRAHVLPMLISRPCLSIQSVESTHIRPNPGATSCPEQDNLAIWSALLASLREALPMSPCAPKLIAGGNADQTSAPLATGASIRSHWCCIADDVLVCSSQRHSSVSGPARFQQVSAKLRIECVMAPT
jgi:hypothetical protein